MAEAAPAGVCRPVPPALGLFFLEELHAEEEEEEEGARGVTTAQVSPVPWEAPSPALLSAPRGPRLTAQVLDLPFTAGLSVKVCFIQTVQGFLFGVFSE